MEQFFRVFAEDREGERRETKRRRAGSEIVTQHHVLVTYRGFLGDEVGEWRCFFSSIVEVLDAFPPASKPS